VIPKKEKRIFHVTAYIMPFWAWGVFFLVVSGIFYCFRFDNSINFFLSLVFLLKGLSLLFLPKRKIKKMIERWENSSCLKKKIFGISLILLVLFLIFK